MLNMHPVTMSNMHPVTYLAALAILATKSMEDRKEMEKQRDEARRLLKEVRTTCDIVEPLLKDSEKVDQENLRMRKDMDSMREHTESILKDTKKVLEDNITMRKEIDSMREERDEMVKDNEALHKENERLRKAILNETGTTPKDTEAILKNTGDNPQEEGDMLGQLAAKKAKGVEDGKVLKRAMSDEDSQSEAANKGSSVKRQRLN